MTDSHRDTLRAVADVWALVPEVRLGQFVAHLGFLAEVHLGKGLADLEDDEFLSILKLHQDELRARSETSLSKPTEELPRGVLMETGAMASEPMTHTGS